HRSQSHTVFLTSGTIGTYGTAGTKILWFQPFHQFQTFESSESVFESASRISEELLYLVENFALLSGFLLEAALPGIQFINLFFQPFNILGQASDRFSDWVGQVGRVEVDNRIACRRMLRLVLYDSTGDADHRGVRRHRSNQHGAGSHPA